MDTATKIQSNVTDRMVNAIWWIDLITSDLAAAKSYYGELFGWEFADMPMAEGGSYSMISKGGCLVAGAMQIGPRMEEHDTTPYWQSYVYVDDIVASTELARQLGATDVMGPFDVQGVGMMTSLTDPSGVGFALWQPITHTGADLVNHPGALVWSELRTRDTTAAREFYTALFGWTAVTQPMGPMEYTTFQIDGRPVAGMLEVTDEMGADYPSFWNSIIGVDSAERAIDLTETAGGLTMGGIIPTPFGRTVCCRDAQGADFTVIEPGEGGFQGG